LGDASKYSFPEPQIKGLDFSFSGLKTSILYFLQEGISRDQQFVEKNLNDICASIQKRIISILLHKLSSAAQLSSIKDICIAGGVSANRGLRKAFEDMGREKGWNTFIPKFEYCTDNAAMIAITGYFKFVAGDFSPLDVSASARAEW